jgi:hypothetical protein
VPEWSIGHAWRACVPQGTEGSNPSPSVLPRNEELTTNEARNRSDSITHSITSLGTCLKTSPITYRELGAKNRQNDNGSPNFSLNLHRFWLSDRFLHRNDAELRHQPSLSVRTRLSTSCGQWRNRQPYPSPLSACACQGHRRLSAMSAASRKATKHLVFSSYQSSSTTQRISGNAVWKVAITWLRPSRPCCWPGEDRLKGHEVVHSTELTLIKDVLNENDHRVETCSRLDGLPCRMNIPCKPSRRALKRAFRFSEPLYSRRIERIRYAPLRIFLQKVRQEFFDYHEHCGAREEEEGQMSGMQGNQHRPAIRVVLCEDLSKELSFLAGRGKRSFSTHHRSVRALRVRPF